LIGVGEGEEEKKLLEEIIIKEKGIQKEGL